MTEATSEPRRDRPVARLLILVCGLAFAVGVVLLAFAVWVDLPGPLAAYGDPEASWPIAVQVVLGAVAFGAWWWINRRRQRPYTVVLLTLGIAVVVVLASSSYARCPDPDQSVGWSVVTRVIGLITNNYAVDMFEKGCALEAPPLALQFARLSQLVVVLVAATSAVLALLRTQMDRLVVKSSRRLSLAVGVDSTSTALLPALAADSGEETRAVLTPDPLAPWLGQARAAGWRVVVGDRWDEASLGRLLRRARGRHALSRVAVLPPDSTEAHRLMSAVLEAVEQASGASGPRRQVRVLLRIDDAWQAEDWRRRYLGRTEEWVVDTISENEVTARLLVEDVLARGAELLLVTGHSDLTFAVAAEVAQQARERAVVGEGPTVPPVVLVDPEAQEVLEEHVLAQARFGNSVTVDITVRADQDVADVVAEATQRHGRPALLFTGDADPTEQRLAARLGATHPSLLVYSRRTEVAGVGDAPLLAQVRAFGTTLDAGGGRPIDNWERMARRIHESYIRKRRGVEPTKESQRPWDELSDFYRESNVRQVLTVMSSAVAVGRSWGATTAQATPPSVDQLDKMVRLEQQSWREYYEKHGWAYGAARVEGKTHPDLLPWDKLNAESQQATRDGVLNALGLLEALGYRSFDDPERQWRRFRRKGEVTAVQRPEAWSWKTSDGTELHAEAGDWEVRDATGSRSVRPDIFEVTHEHLEGARWRRVGVVEARRAVPGEEVHSLEGKQVAGPEHWVMRGVRGEEWLVTTQHLQVAFEPVEE